MKSLIDYWKEAATACGEPLSVPLRALGAETGAYVSLSRFLEWRKGQRGLPREIQRQMLLECLPAILQAHGIMGYPAPDDDAAYESLAAALMPPESNARYDKIE